MMHAAEKPNPATVLATAINQLKHVIKINSQDLAAIIGQHRNTIDRCLKKGELDPSSKPGELALLLIRVYRSLYALNGGDKKAMIHWLNTYNHHIQGVPLQEMKTIMGLSRVVNYLDAMRGKV
ncbi:MbcA/ParS/Xre antitoxin family protein [Legionella sp. WA2022007384]